MKRTILLTIITFIAVAIPVAAHHPAEGIVDEEIYAMIDSMVADTPHADMTFDTMGGSTDIVIETDNFSRFEDLVEDGLVSAVALLDGDVTMTLEFDETRQIVITISQIEVLEKTAGSVDGVSLDELKANFK
jgi:hypothetical protein